MNRDLMKIELPDIHMESDDEIIRELESQISNAPITDKELETLRKFSSTSEKHKGFIPSKCDTMNFPTICFSPSKKTTTNFEEKLEAVNYLLEFRKELESLIEASYKSRISKKRNNEADDDKVKDDQNSDKTFNCSDCSLNPIDDDSDLEPDIITCQFIKIRNRPEKWQKQCKTELTKLSGKSYGIEDLEEVISWS